MYAQDRKTNGKRLRSLFVSAALLTLGGCAVLPSEQIHVPDLNQISKDHEREEASAREESRKFLAEAKLNEQVAITKAACESATTDATGIAKRVLCPTAARLLYENNWDKLWPTEALPSTFDPLFNMGQQLSLNSSAAPVECAFGSRGPLLNCREIPHPTLAVAVAQNSSRPRVTHGFHVSPEIVAAFLAPQQLPPFLLYPRTPLPQPVAAPTATQTVAAATPAQSPAAPQVAEKAPKQKHHLRTVVSQFAKAAVEATFASFDSALYAITTACFLLGGLWAAAFRSRRKEPVRKFREAPPMSRAVPTPVVAPAPVVTVSVPASTPVAAAPAPAPVAPAPSNVVYANFGQAKTAVTQAWTPTTTVQLGAATRAAMQLYGNAPALKAA